MTTFWRGGHYRSGPGGSSTWVDGHWVTRDDWEHTGAQYLRYYGVDEFPNWPGTGATEASYCNPNARCPVCGAPVFFYRSPFGGRVFFDAMEPPWPKHPCTDNPASAVPRMSLQRVSNTNAPWKEAGWEPAVIVEVTDIGTWSLLKLRPVRQTGFLIRATASREEVVPGAPAYIKQLSGLGIGRISLLGSTPNGFRPISQILIHRALTLCPRNVLRAARKGDPNSAYIVSRATAGVLKLNDKIKAAEFADATLADHWLRKAASLGSENALRELPRPAP